MLHDDIIKYTCLQQFTAQSQNNPWQVWAQSFTHQSPREQYESSPPQTSRHVNKRAQSSTHISRHVNKRAQPSTLQSTREQYETSPPHISRHVNKRAQSSTHQSTREQYELISPPHVSRVLSPFPAPAQAASPAAGNAPFFSPKVTFWFISTGLRGSNKGFELQQNTNL